MSMVWTRAGLTHQLAGVPSTITITCTSATSHRN